ncbi:MAG: VOC family protein [Reyranella sp.]|nr:VOC family protein [Reyranella sp.]
MAAEKRPPISPYLTVRGGKAAIDFYKKAFGAKVAMLMMDDDKRRVMHVTLLLNGGTLMLSDAFDEFGDHGGTKPPPEAGGASVTVHLEVPDVDRAWKKAVKAGAAVIMPLADMFWGDRFGKLRDPFGHVWSLAAPVKKKAARKKAAAKKKKR